MIHSWTIKSKIKFYKIFFFILVISLYYIGNFKKITNSMKTVGWICPYRLVIQDIIFNDTVEIQLLLKLLLKIIDYR